MAAQTGELMLQLLDENVLAVKFGFDARNLCVSFGKQRAKGSSVNLLVL